MSAICLAVTKNVMYMLHIKSRTSVWRTSLIVVETVGYRSNFSKFFSASHSQRHHEIQKVEIQKSAGPGGGSVLSVLLKRMCGWMGHAATHLQRCHQGAQEGSAGGAYMEGLDPGHDLNSIAQARQALQVQLCYRGVRT